MRRTRIPQWVGSLQGRGMGNSLKGELMTPVNARDSAVSGTGKMPLMLGDVLKGKGQTEGFRIFRYPRWQYMGFNVTVVLALLFVGVWSVFLRAAGAAWSDPVNILVVAVFFSILIVGQFFRFRFYRRQPLEFLVQDAVLEVHWRNKIRCYRLDRVSVGKQESVPAALCKAVEISTPEDSFLVMEHLKGFDDLISLLKRGGITGSREPDNGRDYDR